MHSIIIQPEICWVATAGAHDTGHQGHGVLTVWFPCRLHGPSSDVSHSKSSYGHMPSMYLVVYITMEVREGTMLGPFDQPPFTPWCQVNVLLTRPKKTSNTWCVIMDLSWPHPPGISRNRCKPKDTYLSALRNMHLPSAQHLAYLIKKAGKGCFLYCCDIARAYRHLPLDSGD